MTKVELLAAARLKLDDTVTPYLWSDAELTSYLEEAEMEAAERADLIEVDGVATYCTISITEDTAAYALNTLVYEVVRARMSTESVYLTRTSREKLDNLYGSWEDTSGTPTHYYVVGNTIRLYPNPSADGTLNLIVLRLPVRPMGTSPEIHTKYHYKMLDWVCHMAYSKRDNDAFNPVEASRYERQFTDSFGPKKDAATRTRQLRHTPTIMRNEYGNRYE